MSERRGISRRELTMAGIIFAFLVLRAVSFGVEYWPQLDDYIQLHNYASAASLMQLQQSVGLLASRPLAGAMDYYVWGKLFDVMIVGVILIAEIILLLTTRERCMIHDKLANTVTVDVASQMIFKTHEDMIAYKQKIAAEKTAAQTY